MNTTHEFDYDYDYDYDDNDNGSVVIEEGKGNERSALSYMYVGVYSLTISLGLPFHMLVICIITCKMKKAAETIWFLGLSIADLVVILFLPLHITSALDDFSWPFSGALCKTCSFLMFLDMHSTALWLAFLSVIRCLACCKPTLSKILFLVCWSAGAILSTPSLFYRDTRDSSRGTVCRDTYQERGKEAKAIAMMRFLSGWLFPFAVVFVSSGCMSMRTNIRRASKAHGVIRAMTVAYFLCWLPYHVLVLFRLYATEWPRFLSFGLPVSVALSFFNSCINPFIYILIGKSMDMSWMLEAFSSTNPTNSRTNGRETRSLR